MRGRNLPASSGRWVNPKKGVIGNEIKKEPTV